jgi:CheY-like chemotaxis protein
MYHPAGAAMSSHPILVVDDDSAILDLIAQVLVDEGYQVLTCGSGHTAVELAREWFPRLILLDLMMPEMNGWQVVAALKASPQTRAIPVMILSARRDVAETADHLGVTAFLEKPFDLDELLSHVHRILSRNGYSSTKADLIGG